MVAATGTGLLPMRVGKVVGLKEGGEFFEFAVLDQLDGDEHLIIRIGSAEAFALAASLGGTEFGRPMTYQFMLALVQGVGGRVREVRLDRIVQGAYAATVEAEGSGRRLCRGGAAAQGGGGRPDDNPQVARSAAASALACRGGHGRHAACLGHGCQSMSRWRGCGRHLPLTAR